MFLDAVQQRYVDELGGMNIFFVYDDGSIVTPPLTGTILPGVTRLSVMTLAENAGHPVVERPVAFDEWRADAASGRLRSVVSRRQPLGGGLDHGICRGDAIGGDGQLGTKCFSQGFQRQLPADPAANAGPE